MVGFRKSWYRSAKLSPGLTSFRFVGYGGLIRGRFNGNIVSKMYTILFISPGILCPVTHITLCSVLIRTISKPFNFLYRFPMCPGTRMIGFRLFSSRTNVCKNQESLLFFPGQTRAFPCDPMFPGLRCVFVAPWVAGIPLNPQRFMTPWKPRSILKNSKFFFVKFLRQTFFLI